MPSGPCAWLAWRGVGVREFFERASILALVSMYILEDERMELRPFHSTANKGHGAFAAKTLPLPNQSGGASSRGSGCAPDNH